MKLVGNLKINLNLMKLVEILNNREILQIFDKIRLLLSGQHFPLSASLDLRFSDFWSLILMIILSELLALGGCFSERSFVIVIDIAVSHHCHLGECGAPVSAWCVRGCLV